MQIEKRGFIYLLFNMPQNLDEEEAEEFIRAFCTKISGHDYTETRVRERTYIDDYQIDPDLIKKLAPYLKKNVKFRTESETNYHYYWIEIDDAIGCIEFSRDGVKLERYTIDSVSPQPHTINDMIGDVGEEARKKFGEKYGYYLRFPITCYYDLEPTVDKLNGQHKEVVIKIMDAIRALIKKAEIDVELWATPAECREKIIKVDNCVELAGDL